MDADYFFFHGQIDLGDEIEQDILLGIAQPKRSLFYNRGYGCGLSAYEGGATSLLSQVGMRYDVATLLAKRNQVVSNGVDGYPERRAIASQNTIKVETNAKGENQLTVLYVPLYDFQKNRVATMPIGARS